MSTDPTDRDENLEDPPEKPSPDTAESHDDKPEPDLSAKPEGGDESDEDPDIEEKDGKKLVDLRALHKERGMVKQLRKQVKELGELTTQLLMQQASGEKAPPKTEPDPGLVRMAKRLNIVNDKNELDLDRAAVLRDVLREEFSEFVRPLREDSDQDRAANLRRRMRETKFDDGQPIADSKIIEQVLDTLPLAHQAQTDVGNLALLVAAGIESLQQRRAAHKRGGRGPVFTEGAGGRHGAPDPSLSALDAAAMRSRGKTPEQWAKLIRRADDSVLDDLS